MLRGVFCQIGPLPRSAEDVAVPPLLGVLSTEKVAWPLSSAESAMNCDELLGATRSGDCGPLGPSGLEVLLSGGELSYYRA